MELGMKNGHSQWTMQDNSSVYTLAKIFWRKSV